MIITKELIMTVLIAFGIGKYSEFKSPKYYDLVADNGAVYNVKIDKKTKYACPLHCGIDHYHKVLMLNEEEALEVELYNIVGYGKDEMYINSYAVSQIQEIDMNKGKEPTKLKKFNIQTYLP